MPAWLVLGFYVLVDNLLPFLSDAGGSTAHGAHLGGFFAGMALAWVGERLDWRIPGAHRPERPARVGNFRGGHDDEAAGNSVSAQVERLLVEGRDDEALRRVRRALPAAKAPGEQARLVFLLGLLRLRQGQTTAAYQNLLAALELGPEARTEARIREALSLIQVHRRP